MKVKILLVSQYNVAYSLLVLFHVFFQITVRHAMQKKFKKSYYYVNILSQHLIILASYNFNGRRIRSILLFKDYVYKFFIVIVVRDFLSEIKQKKEIEFGKLVEEIGTDFFVIVHQNLILCIYYAICNSAYKEFIIFS